MEIEILKKGTTPNELYQISIDSHITHTAIKLASDLPAEINLFESNNAFTKPRLTISRKPAWFAAKYDIKPWDNDIIEFRTKSVWKTYYQCQCGTDTYDIYGHRRRKYSIYKNNRQIAWWDKGVVSEFKGDNYRIIADKRVDYDLLISFCLIINDFTSPRADENYAYLDIGNIGPQEKKFDKNWSPK